MLDGCMLKESLGERESTMWANSEQMRRSCAVPGIVLFAPDRGFLGTEMDTEAMKLLLEV